MATAIFHKAFNFSSRKRNAGWSIKASTSAQSFPQEVIDAAIKAGAAKLPPKGTTQKADG